MPPSLGLLSQLTSLNLSGCRLTAFPMAILALDSLVDLDLSSNQLTVLWPASTAEWRPQVRELVSSALAAGVTQSPNSSVEGSFMDAFPSSPRRPTRTRFTSGADDGAARPRPPLPALRTFNLANNRVGTAALADEFELPPALQALDLSGNALTSPLPAKVFAPLRSLVTLDLRGNELSDEVFSGPVASFLPALRSLDLTSNALDSLAGVERVLTNRLIAWPGLPATLRTLVPSANASMDGVVTVSIGSNMLRDEPRRRRAALAVAPAPSAATEDVRTPRSSAGSFVTADGSIDAATAQMGALSVAPSRDAGEAVVVLSAYNPDKLAIELAGRSLTSMPHATAAVDPSIAPESFDASKNALTTLPIDALLSWGFHRTLRSLTISQNRLGALALVGTAASARFDVLERLDLTNNRIPSMCADGQTPTLAAIAQMFPAARSVDLGMNALTAIDGIGSLLLREDGSAGVFTLRLAGNQIESLEPLVEVAQRASGAERARWTCEELDLRDNAIAKVRPAARSPR